MPLVQNSPVLVATEAAATSIGAAVASVIGAVLMAVLSPAQAGGSSEIQFENANNDLYHRRRAVRAFYAQHLSPTEVEDCDKQWHEAIQACTEELSQPSYRVNKRMTGGHENIFDCARGLVSEECGGNIR